MDKIINISSVGQDPALFQAKLNKNISIPPNSSIAVIGGLLGNNFTINVDSTNDTLAFLFGSGLGSIDGDITANNGCDIFKPFTVKLKHGSWDTRFQANFTHLTRNTILYNLIESFNEQCPYKCYKLAGEYTTNAQIAIYVYVPDFAVGRPALYDPPNNLAHMNIINQANYLQVQDVQGGYIFESDEDLVFPCANHIKNEMIKYGIPQANYRKLVLGFCLKNQIEYRDEEEFSTEKDWVIPFDGQEQKASATTAEKYLHKLPFCIKVDDDGFFVIEINEVVNPSTIGDLYSETVSTVDANAQNTNIFVKTILDVANDMVRMQYQIDFENANGANLQIINLDVPDSHMGNLYRLVGILDSNHAQTIEVSCVEDDHILLDDTVGSVDDSIDGGELDIVMVSNRLLHNTTISAVPAFEAGTDLIQISRKCNNKFFLDAKNYEIIFGSSTDADPSNLSFNTVGDANKQVCHINLTNLPINSEQCTTLRGSLTQTVYSVIVNGGEYEKDLQPYEKHYIKLKNKQPITISSIDVKITDSGGGLMDSLVNTTELFLHLKEGSVTPISVLNRMTSQIKSLQDNFDMFMKKPI